MISIIIPVFNDGRPLAATLADLRHQPVEIIVVDGGSSDDSRQVAQAHHAHLICSARGRAVQMNRGAARASGDILLFLHADTILPPDFIPLVQQALAGPGVVAGAFSLKLTGEWWGLKMVSSGANFRSRLLQLPYGDQAIFMKAATFQAAGGFPHQEIMEDVCLIRNLARRGRIIILPQTVSSSGRRWQRLGLRATIINQLILLGFYFGLSTDFLAEFYRGVKKT